MVDIRRGDIYWVDLGPIVSSAPAKIRPFLIIQVDEITTSGIKTVIGCALTSNLDADFHKGAVELPKEATGLSKDSVAKLTEITTFDMSRLDQCVGNIGIENMLRIDEAIRDVLGV